MTDERLDLPSLALLNEYVAAIKAGDLSAMQSLQAPDFILDWVHSDVFADTPLTHDRANQFWSIWLSAYAEMDYEVTRTVAAETVVVCQWIFSGTHTGTLSDPIFNPPQGATGKTIRMRGISVYDIDGGLIQRETMYIDLATLYVELGVTL